MKTVQTPVARVQMKGILPVLFLLATVATSVALQSGDFTYVVNAPAMDSVTITNYTGSGGTVTIPDTIESLPVTGIGDEAFRSISAIHNGPIIQPVSIASEYRECSNNPVCLRCSVM